MQGMAHVATPEFYQNVAELVARRRAEGWLVFYEEVRNDLGQGNQGFSELLRRLGAEWSPRDDVADHRYEFLAPVVGEGLVLQDNAAILGQPGPEVRNVDVTLSELLAALP